MVVLMQKGEIAFFRYRNRLQMGMCSSLGEDKIRFSVSMKGTVNVPIANILLSTGKIVGDWEEAAIWWSNENVQFSEIDLLELWNLVLNEEEDWQAEDLAELYFGDRVRPIQVAAMLVALEDSAYFEHGKNGYRPFTEIEVTKRQELQSRQKARVEEQTLFQKWFREWKDMKNVPNEVESWIERLKDYVLFGDQSTHHKWVGRMCEGPVTTWEIFDWLAKFGVWEVDEHLDLIREGVSTDFPVSVISASKELVLESLMADVQRRDLTSVSVVTIDDEDTTDRDDGVSLRFQENGAYTVGVHITDVASLIPMGSELDREAATRGASLYFPERKVPMFPTQVSEDLGSLCPGVSRLALSLLFDISSEGLAKNIEIVPSVIRCREKLTYDEVDIILEDPSNHLYSVLSGLYRVAEDHLVERFEKGAVALEHSERRVRVTPQRGIRVSMRPRQSRADLLVSELMVMANVACAKFCCDREIPIFYRVQQSPDLTNFENNEHELVYRYRMLSCMQRAQMTLEPGIHSGLGVSPYCQASSPLRRYADLVVQRQILASILGNPLPYNSKMIQELSFLVEERMLRASRLERCRERYWLFRYLERFVGEMFDAVVLMVWKWAFRAEIPKYGLQTNVSSCRPVKPGETVRIRLRHCDAWEDKVVFVQVD